jgi:hypothetical protein
MQERNKSKKQEVTFATASVFTTATIDNSIFDMDNPF